jgi:thymidylate kinase
MIFIIEGPDGAGKTTLANKLSQQTGYQIIHRVKPETQEDKDEMMKTYLDVINSGKNCIFDRAWYSEMVYGPIMRDKSYISIQQMYELERKLTKRGGLLIYCTDAPNILFDRAVRRGETYIIDKPTFGLIYKKYIEIMQQLPHLIPLVKYECQDMP